MGDINPRDVAQDVSPFLKNRPEEVEAQAEEAEEQDPLRDLPRVCEERGKLYRHPATGARARLMRVKWSQRCEKCGEAIPKNAQALGISKDEEGNKSGRWVFGCMECAENSTFEATAQPGFFSKREEG
jgi:hypothetical protein